MTIESQQPLLEDPTSGSYPDLFFYPAAKKDELKLRILETEHALTICVNANNTMQNYLVKTSERFERLSETSIEMSEELDLQRSSVTVGRMFLILRNEAQTLGISDRDFIDMFKLCTKINTKVSTKLFHDIHRERGIERIKIENVRQEQPKIVNKVLDEYGAVQQPWFKGSKAQWREFLIKHSIFFFHFQGKDSNSLTPEGLRINGDTYKYGVPDWFDELDAGALPTREAVEKEILEDTESAKSLYAGLKSLFKSREYTIREEMKKTFGYANMVERTKNKLELSIDNFPLLLISLANCHTGGFLLKANAQEEFVAGRRPFEYIKPAKLLERTIDAFLAEESRVLCKEIVAMWIEDTLIKSKSVSDDLKVVSPDFQKTTVDLVDSISGDSQASLEFKQTLGTNKRLYYSLIKDIAPLLIHLTPNEIDYLKEIISEFGERNVGQIILEAAEVISYHAADFGQNPTKESESVIRRMREYTKKILIRDHVDLFNAFACSLFDDDPNTPDSDNDNLFEEKALKIETEAIAEESANISKGNLAGWQLIYSNNRTLLENHLDIVGGESLEEREQALEEYVKRNGISCSIKIASVIRTFDWLVTIPEETEWLAMRKEANGVMFKKKKRGRVRILYRMEPDIKKIVFFLHQKKDWDYGF